MADAEANEKDKETALAFCQKWKDEKTGLAAGFTLHHSKQEWKMFMRWRVEHYNIRVRWTTPESWGGPLKRAGIHGLIPDGYAYSCEISREAKRHIGKGTKFDGPGPLPRYLLRWNPELRKHRGEEVITLYAIHQLRSVFLSHKEALKFFWCIKEIVGVGVDAGETWSKKLTQDREDENRRLERQLKQMLDTMTPEQRNSYRIK